jgi:hypothetical protein
MLSPFIIPGQRAAMSPEPKHTDLTHDAQTPELRLQPSVFMGSGLAIVSRPGMTS